MDEAKNGSVLPPQVMEDIKKNLMSGGAVIKTPAEKEAEQKRAFRVRDLAVTMGKLAAGCDVNEFMSALVITAGGMIGAYSPDPKSMQSALVQHANNVRNVATQNFQAKQMAQKQAQDNAPPLGG
jgi:hypothetical protein